MSKDGDNLFGDFDFNLEEAVINTGESTPPTQTKEETTVDTQEEEIVSTSTDETQNQPNEDGLVDTDLFVKTSDTNETDNKTTSSTTEDDSSGSSSSPLSSGLVSALGAEGFINVTEEELEGVEDVAQFLRDKLNESINEKVKGGLTEKQQKALEAFEKGVPIENYVNSNAREESYTQISNEQIEQRVDWQQELVRRMLIQTGFSEEDAADTINTYKEVGGDKLKTKAIEARDKLIKYEQAYKLQLEEQAEAQMKSLEEERQNKLKSTEEFINSKNEIITGIPLTDTVKKNIYNTMTTPVGEIDGAKVNAIGKLRAENPEKFDMMIAYYYNLGMFNEIPDFSKIRKAADAKAASGLNELLKEGTGFLKSDKPKNGGGNKSGSFDDALNSFLD